MIPPAGLPHQPPAPEARILKHDDQSDHREDDDHDEDDIPGGHVSPAGIGGRDHILRADLELRPSPAVCGTAVFSTAMARDEARTIINRALQILACFFILFLLFYVIRPGPFNAQGPDL